MTKALDELEAKTSAEIQAATMLMQTCICYLLSNRIVRVNRGNFVEELNTYIDNHISQEITVKDLCKYFGMSRSSFYALADQCLKGGVMKHIRRMRIEHYVINLHTIETDSSKVIDKLKIKNAQNGYNVLFYGVTIEK